MLKFKLLITASLLAYLSSAYSNEAGAPPTYDEAMAGYLDAPPTYDEATANDQPPKPGRAKT